jgi:hypothetical protein
MRRGGGIAILLGAAVGATAALSLRHNAAPPRPALAAQAPSPRPRAAEPPVPPASAPALAPPAASADPLVLVPAPATGPAPTGSSPFRLAPALPPVTTAAELERAEVRCYEAAPEECGRAADAYDVGQLVARDPERAARLRKIELTRLVRACERRSPHACLVLAGRYASGQGVPESEKHALGLVEHARDLCRHKAAKAECDGGEPK